MRFCLAWTLLARYGTGRGERFAEAIQLMQEVIQERTNLYSRQSRQVALTLATLSPIYRVAEGGDDELAMLTQAGAIMQRLGGDVVGSIFVDCTTSQGLRKLKLMDQALAFHKRAYEALRM